MLNESTKFCRVCGLEQPYPQYGEDGCSPTFEICECCGVEFGYEDTTAVGVKRFRHAWELNGRKWFEPDKMPENWSWEKQKLKIPYDFS